jgi:cephalosporin hydroxylase
LVEGSSTDEKTIAAVHALAAPYQRIMVFLDSMHTQDHVLAELRAYAPLVSVGSYCVVFDTFVEDMPQHFFSDRPWDVGNNPKTAVRKFLDGNSDFEIEREIQHKLQITVCPDGFLKRVR